MPGAGTYDPDHSKVQKSAQKVTMKIKLQGAIGTGKSLSPGPGGYDVHLKNKKAAPQFGFGSSTRAAMGTKNISPGPGAYKINTTVGDVPAYAIPNRPDEHKYI